jgi:protein SCO1/2
MIRRCDLGCQLIAVALLAALPGLRAMADESGAGAPAARAENLSSSPRLSVIAPAPDFTLFDTAGNTVRLSDYRGRVVVLAFVFTSCPGVCPVISRQMAALQAELKKPGLFPQRTCMLSVTVDPETDTPEVLTKYAESFGADPSGWRFLRDEPDRLKKVLARYDEWTRLLPKGEIDHPARVYLLDQRGRIREIYSLSFFDERQAKLDMLALLREQP